MQKINSCVTAAVVLVAGASFALADPPQVGNQQDKDRLATVRWPTTRQKLFTLPESVWMGSLAFSPDGRTLCIQNCLPGKKYQMVVNGKPGRVYDGCGKMEFSANSSGWAYIALDGGRYLWVINGVEQKRYAGLYHVAFSADGKQFSYTAATDKHAVLFHAGKEIKQEGLPFALAISPDGKRVAHHVGNGGKHTVMVDGVIGKPYDGILIDGMVFSPDSKRFAYTAKFRNRRFAVLDGKVSDVTYRGISVPAFSGDSQTMAYLAWGNKGRVRSVINGVEGKLYKSAMDPVFSLTGSTYAYCSQGLDGIARVVVDGKEGPELNSYTKSSLILSADGKRSAYLGAIRPNLYAYIDGKRYEDRSIGPRVGMVFSPDSKRIAFVGRSKSGHSVLVVDGKKMFAFNSIRSPVFSPDSKRVACIAMSNDDHYVWVDGLLGSRILRLPKQAHPVFTGPDTVEILECRGRTYYRTRISLGRQLKLSDDEWPEAESHEQPTDAADGGRN
jgi:WD40 repeat protein